MEPNQTPLTEADRLTLLEQKLDATYKSVEKMRKYFFWTMIISVAVIVLPLIGLVFALPNFFNYYGTIQNLSQ